MPGLALDLPDGKSCGGGAGGKSGTERMPRVAFRVEPDLSGALFHYDRDGARRKSALKYLAGLADWPKQLPVRDSGHLQPTIQCGARADRASDTWNNDATPPALLVRLAPGQRDLDALLCPLDPFAVDRAEFGPAKRTGKPNQQERPVPNIPRRTAEGGDDGGQVLDPKRRHASLRTPVAAADAADGEPDQLGLGRVYHPAKNGRPPYCYGATGKGRHRKPLSVRREILGDCCWFRGNGPTPSEKMREVAVVGSQSVRRCGGGDEIEDFGIGAFMVAKW